MDSTDLEMITKFQEGFTTTFRLENETRFNLKILFVPSLWDYKNDESSIAFILSIPNEVNAERDVKFYNFNWSTFIGSELWIEGGSFGVRKTDQMVQSGQELGKRCLALILERLELTCKQNNIPFNSPNLVDQLLLSEKTS
jgi:hypothetical protein